jgi:hypothetical protein
MTANLRVRSCIVGVFAACFLSTASIVHSGDRQPVPNAAATKEASELVKEIFGKEIGSAKTPDQKATLTKKLLEEASRPDTTPAGRYALMQAALDSTPDALAAMSVVDNMAKHFQIDSLNAKASTVWRMSNDARTSSQHSAVAQVALQLVNESVNRDAYDPAIKLAEIALNAAQEAGDGKLILEIRAKTLELSEGKADFEKVQKAMTVLKNDPINAEANFQVGRHKCLVRGDWEGGIPMLALGSDEVLKDLATRDLKAPTTSNEQIELADGWYDLAQKLDESNGERISERASFWYQLSLKSAPEVSRLLKVKVEKRLEKLLRAQSDQVNLHEKEKRLPAVDLLRLIRAVDVLHPQRHPTTGKWNLPANTIRTPDAFGTLFKVPYAVPKEYDLEIILKRLGGANAFVLLPVINGHRFRIDFDSHNGAFTRACLTANDNITFSQERLLLQGKTVKITCCLRESGFRVAASNREIFNWKGPSKHLVLEDASWLDPVGAVLTAPYIVLGTHSEFEITSLTLVPIVTSSE